MLVYATATCPICLVETNPVVALPCGHATCRNHFADIGGTINAPEQESETSSEATLSTQAAEDILEAFDVEFGS